MSKYKDYLGDGVYVDINVAWQLVLTSEDGVRVLNTIYLDPRVYNALNRYVDRIRKQAKEGTVNP